MARFHVVDEAVIAGTPQEVADALADESAGRSSWFMPTLKMRTRDRRRFEELDAVTDHWVYREGREDRPVAHFVTQVTDAGPGRVERAHIEGCFRGREVWTFEPVDESHTRITVDWQTRTHGILLGILARPMDIGGQHSRTLEKGFAGLQAHIAAGRGSLQPREPSS